MGLFVRPGGEYLVMYDYRGRYITLTSVPFSPNDWHTLKLQVEADGDVLPYMDGKLALPEGVTPIRMPDDIEIGFGDGNTGLEVSLGSNPTPDFPEGASLLVDNFQITSENHRVFLPMSSR